MTEPGPAATILVVDDDEGLVVLMAESLRAEGFNVETANSGSAALAALERHTPDLMLLDLKMQDVGGQALVERLKRHHTPVPFLVVTGQGDEKVAVEVMKQGALDYVMKDTALIDLLPGVVRRALEAIARDRELTLTQESLRESESRFAAAVRATNDGVWEWLIPEHRVYFSARWKAILGFEPEEGPATVEQWRALVHPEDLERRDNAFREFLAGSGTIFSLENRLRHKNGSYRWLHARAVLERGRKGEPLRMTGAAADVTERKQLEKEILSISDREQRRIGQDLHDGLGQQLTATEFMAESLKADLVNLKDTRPDLLAQITRMGGFLREAITQTRALAHGLTAFMLDASGLHAAVAELVQRTNALGRLRCRFVCREPVLLQDSETAGHVYRIAQEAVANAVRHAAATEIVVTLTARGGHVVLKITDNGKGMPEAKKHGSGIGLQVMHHRANAIGAELTIESKRDKGVTVICRLRRNP
ncbi:MAG: response regulator [Opitutaceae bacterium]|nr:response regulator [Opitutaceae bacterium]